MTAAAPQFSTDHRLPPPHSPNQANGEARRFDTVALIVTAIGVCALTLRLWDLGARAMHHDESLHATFSWYFAQAAPLYKHDPLMHGPFQFHAMALVFKLFGASDYTARVPAALAGTALVFTPLLFRRWLGTVGTVAAAALITLSPSLLYYSRFAREDSYIALWTVLMVAAIWRYRDDGRDRWLLTLAAGLALAFATKESAYFTTAILLLYCDATLTQAWLDQRGVAGRQRWREGLLLAPIAWLLVATWGALKPARKRLRLTSVPREGDLLVVLGVLTLPQLAAGVQIPLVHLHVVTAGDTAHLAGVITMSLLGIAMVVGGFWDRRRWLFVSLIFYGITIPLFTTGFTNLRGGITSDFWGALDYWIGQQGVGRGDQPWFYYLMLLPLYGFMPLIPAAIGGWWLLQGGHRLATLFAWWFLGTLAALTSAAEKMPWLLTHLTVPLVFLAALVANETVPRAWARLRAHDGERAFLLASSACAVVILLMCVLSVKVAFGVAFAHPDTPVEPLIYTQTSPDVPKLSQRIHWLANQMPASKPLSVVIGDSERAAWPWAWYLRDLRGTTYTPTSLFTTPIRPDSVTLVLGSSPDLAQRGVEIPYHHRWWFPEAGYRTVTGASMLTDVLTGKLFRQWLHFELHEVSATHLGSVDGEAYFPTAAALGLPAGSNSSAPGQ